MKKYFILSITAFFVFHFTQAQSRIALIGGGHISSVNETNDLPDWNSIKDKYSSRTGVHFGFLADLPVGMQSKIYFQPGVVFYNKGRIFSNTYDTSVYNYFSIDQDQFINYVEAPINLVFKQPINKSSKFFIGGGPYISFFYNGREKTETYHKSGNFTTEENTDLPIGNAPGKYKTFDLGINGTIGIEFKNFFISGNYSKSLTDFYQANYSGSFKHQVIGGTLGIFIGKPVYPAPKIKDSDKDGIPDDDDICVDEAGPAVTAGCPDKDADGIADRLDKCPDQKGTQANNGCPVLDSDGDGINDDEDKCKNVAGTTKYNGCPVPDTDKDGINDEEDKCKDVPGLARYEGCPAPDRDGDGINDDEDKCPEKAGPKENNGCPVIQKEIIEKVDVVAKKIQFEVASPVLKAESRQVLDEIVEILLRDASINLLVEGHTSNDGNRTFNLVLSEKRAENVKNFLVQNGIDDSRITTIGYGPDKPLNEGKTNAEKALNRRVELKLSN